jgi:hypothetical protein
MMSASPPTWTPNDVAKLAQIRQSMRRIAVEELERGIHNVIATLPEDFGRPIQEFASEHQHHTLLFFRTDVRVAGVFCPQDRKGIWLAIEDKMIGRGPLTESHLDSLLAVAAEKGLL